MEALLRRGYWVVWLATFFASSASESSRAGARWWFVAAVAVCPLGVLASSLRGPEIRVFRLPRRRELALRRTAVRLRWPLVVAYVVVTAVSAQRRYDSVPATVAATVAACAAAAYTASRVRPSPAEAQERSAAASN